MNRKTIFNWTSLLLLPVLLATSWIAAAHHHRGCGDSGCEISHQNDAPVCACDHHAVTSPSAVSESADGSSTLIACESGDTYTSHCLICSLLSTHLSTPAVVFEWSPVAVVDSTSALSSVTACRQFSGFYRSRAPPAIS